MIVSPSKISTYNNCPISYHWIYDLKLLTLPTKALTLGTKYHELVRQYHIDGDCHEHKIGEEYDLLHSYIKNPMPGEIVDTEKSVIFDIPGTEHRARIIVDRMDTDKTIDYKTTSIDYKIEDCKNIQSLMYTYWRWLEEGKIYPFYFHVVNKKKVHQKKYKPQIMGPIIYTEEELNELPKIVNDFVEDVESGNFKEKPGGNPWFCAFGPIGLNTCPYHSSKNFYKRKKRK